MPVTIAALNAIQGPGAQVKEIGPQYDLLLATRDGSTLPCRNKDGDVVNVAKLAFMTSVSERNQQHEETELQHKDQLVQLASPNLIDREFDQWPQVSQGDWSGGTGQRVFTGATPITGGVESDPTRYWDGLGILWPINDYLPQQPVQANADQGEAGAGMTTFGPGTATGPLVNLVGNSNNGFAYMYQQTTGAKNNVLVIQGDGVQRTITNPPGTAANTVYTVDFIFAFGYLWYLADSGANVILDYIDGSVAPVVTNAMTINNATIIRNSLAAAGVGGKLYIAFAYVDTATVGLRIRIIDVTNSSFATFTDVPLGTQAVLGQSVQQLEFLGDTVIASVQASNEMLLLQYNISSNTLSTLAKFPASNNLYFAVVAGSIFVLATQEPLFANVPASADMYLVQGGNVQNIGPLIVQNATAGPSSNFIRGAVTPAAFGSYAVFAVYYTTSAGVNRMAVYAYDVLRGRLFHLSDIPSSATMGNASGRRMGILLSTLAHPFGAGNLAAQWGVAAPVLGTGTTNVQRLLMAVSNGRFQPFLQQGSQIVSSLVDFTSAQLKLFRQVVVTWAQPGLPVDPGVSVTVDVWLDQDPVNLSVVPDFTTTVAGGAAVAGQTQLKLTINRIAHKLVYRVTTTGPDTSFTPAVKLQTVVIRAATGWTRTMILDLADNVMTNGKAPGTTAWSAQQPPGQPQLDAMVARDFLRQLWRLQGGECVAVFPGFDPPANWLLQDLHFDSPKPFGVSFRSDQRSRLESVCQLKAREDV